MWTFENFWQTRNIPVYTFKHSLLRFQGKVSGHLLIYSWFTLAFVFQFSFWQSSIFITKNIELDHNKIGKKWADSQPIKCPLWIQKRLWANPVENQGSRYRWALCGFQIQIRTQNGHSSTPHTHPTNYKNGALFNLRGWPILEGRDGSKMGVGRGWAHPPRRIEIIFQRMKNTAAGRTWGFPWGRCVHRAIVSSGPRRNCQAGQEEPWDGMSNV